MNIEQFKDQLKTNPKGVLFEETMALIDNHYRFSETGFHNGNLYNQAGENSGSCRLFAFAKLNGLSESDTLICFGQYYEEVKQTPEGDAHQNIRQFMQTGWSKLAFDQLPLDLK